MRTGSWHETLRVADEAPLSSNRSFGLVFSAVFAAMGMVSLWHGRSRGFAGLAIAALFLLTALVAPKVLGPLNRGWAWFGQRLARVTSPVFMAVLFCGVLTPVGLVMRACGKDPLRRRLDPKMVSYWIERHREDSGTSSMKNQF